MKANEAPDKIYLHPTAKREVGASWLAFPLTNEDVEYTRTDAFIEKACEFIETYPHLIMGVLRSEVIEDFKEYLKK